MSDIERAMAQWRQIDADLDVDTMEIVVRLARLGTRVAAGVDSVHRRAGLGPGDFDVLATLLRAGPSTPTDLARTLLLSKAGISGRVARLLPRGLIAEQPDARDGRGKLVSLTAAGKAALEGAVHDHVRAERACLEPLSSDERTALLTLLRRATREGDSSN